MAKTIAERRVAEKVIEQVAKVPFDCPSIHAYFCENVDVERLIDAIESALLTVAREQRERDAEICSEIARNRTFGMATRDTAEVCANEIRTQETSKVGE